MPSGILSGKTCVIGAGCVVDPEVLIEELDDLDRARDRRPRAVHLSGNAHLIMPWHVAHRPGERAPARQAPDRDDAPRHRPGVRGQGRAARHPRAGPARPEDPARRRSRSRSPRRTSGSSASTGPSRSSSRRSRERYEGYAQRLRPYVADTSLLVDRALRRRAVRALRGRAGDAARPRPRHVSVRDLVEPGRGVRARPASASARTGSTRSSASSKAYVTRVGEGPFPTRDRGARPGARARARRRVRHGHRPRAPLRLARPRRAALRGARERDHVARADEARRALGVRRAAGLRRATGCATARETRDFPAHQSDFHHAEPVYETLPGLARAARRGRRRRRAAGRGARATSSSSSASSASRSRSSARAPSASACSRARGLEELARPSPSDSNVTTSLAIASSRGVMIMRPASRPTRRHATRSARRSGRRTPRPRGSRPRRRAGSRRTPRRSPACR